MRLSEQYYTEKLQKNVLFEAKYAICILGHGVVGKTLYEQLSKIKEVKGVIDQKYHQKCFSKVLLSPQNVKDSDAPLTIVVSAINQNEKIVKEWHTQTHHQVIGHQFSEAIVSKLLDDCETAVGYQNTQKRIEAYAELFLRYPEDKQLARQILQRTEESCVELNYAITNCVSRLSQTS